MTIFEDYKKLISFREGANYCKMDLHTHSPASECSSYTLPKSLDEIIQNIKPKSGNKKACNETYGFFKKLSNGNGIENINNKFNNVDISKLPRLTGKAILNKIDLKKIANTWLDAIKCERKLNDEKVDASGKQYEMLSLAYRDIKNYLASIFFPEEFVLRCYIERLQVVAITDHNHPGYIVPVLHSLSTWYNALQAVNQIYTKDILENKGKNVIQVIRERLEWAKKRIKSDKSELIQKEDHKEEGVSKKLKEKKERLKYINERIEYWKNENIISKLLKLFPGVEITVSACHLLAVFPPQWYIPGRINAILRTIGIPEEIWGQGFIAAATSSVQDTISLIDENGGIAIPAHSNSNFKGVLRVFKKGLELKKILEHPALLAFETIGGTVISGKNGNSGKNACETLKWLSDGKYAPDRVKPICFVKGSDAHECRIECDGTGEDLGMRYTNIKIDIRPNDTADEVFAALRLALVCGYGRVIEFPVENSFNYHAGKKDNYEIYKADREKLLDYLDYGLSILGMTVYGKDSYADGLQIRFNPFLNCIVGSGGKSTIIRMIGYAFGKQGFMKDTNEIWLPDLIRVFFCYKNKYYCVEKSEVKKSFQGQDKTVLYILSNDNSWNTISKSDNIIEELDNLVVLWPSNKEQDEKRMLNSFEESIVKDLIKKLNFNVSNINNVEPLLINQPIDIFNLKSLFDTVLAKPYLKGRQIIWSTGSVNVPVAMDAEKIHITSEIGNGEQMELICGGDLSEEEVREEFLNHFEGGYYAFSRRKELYGFN